MSGGPRRRGPHPTTQLSPFGERVVDAMARLNLTNQELAVSMGVDHSTVHYWLTRSHPPIQRFQQLCLILKTSPNELLGWSPPPEIHCAALAGPISDLKRAVRMLETLSRPAVVRPLNLKKEATHGQ